MSLTCSKTFSLKVTSACGAGTDWINAPGTCRLRVQGYIPTLFPNFAAALPGGAVVWDGTLPTLVGTGVFAEYDSDPTVDNINGMLVCNPGGLHLAGVYLNWTGAKWGFEIAVNTGACGSLARYDQGVPDPNPLAGLAGYSLVAEAGGYAAPASIILEAYSL